MQIGIRANEEQKEVLLQKAFPPTVRITWLNENSVCHETFIAVFDLLHAEPEQAKHYNTDLLFINSVITTCAELPANCIRINAWPGFLNIERIEIAAPNELIKLQAEQVLQQLGWKFTWVPDVVGMIAARIVSMIINEAYYGLQDGISTKEEIDTAMKLGTNYPYGPFEWCRKIGFDKVVRLLTSLEETDIRYASATILLGEAKNTTK